MAINFVKNDDIRILRDIEQYYSTQIDEMPMNGTKQPMWAEFLFYNLLVVVLQLNLNEQEVVIFGQNNYYRS